MPRTHAGRLIHGGRFGRLVLMGAAVASAFAVFAVGEITGRRFGEAVLLGFVISVTLGAGGFGLRGGLLVGLLCSALTAIWWVQHDEYEGTSWIVADAARQRASRWEFCSGGSSTRPDGSCKTSPTTTSSRSTCS